MQVLNIFKKIKTLEFKSDYFDESQEAQKIHLPQLETLKVWNYRQLSYFSQLTALGRIKMQKSYD